MRLFFTCHTAPPSEIQLFAPLNLAATFFTWEQGVDGGPPHAVARTLAEALCLVGYLATFLSPLAAGTSPTWQKHDLYWTQSQTKLLKKPVPLICTNSPALVMKAFDESWTTQGQIILLHKTPTHPVVFDAFEAQGNPNRVFGLLAEGPFTAALLPGVDGDFAGLYGNSLGGFLNHALAEACRRSGVGLMPVASWNELLNHSAQ